MNNFDEAIQVKDPTITGSVLEQLLEKFRPTDPRCPYCGSTMTLGESYLYRSSGGKAWSCDDDGCRIHIGEAMYLLHDWPNDPTTPSATSEIPI